MQIDLNKADIIACHFTNTCLGLSIISLVVFCVLALVSQQQVLSAQAQSPFFFPFYAIGGSIVGATAGFGIHMIIKRVLEIRERQAVPVNGN